MPRQTANPRDLTGLQAERLATQQAREVKEAQSRMSVVTPVEFDSEVYDTPEPIFADQSEVEPSEDGTTVVEVKVPRRKMRVNADLEDVTIGAGNTVSFFVGHLYDVPAPLYDHLEEKGYVWH